MNSAEYKISMIMPNYNNEKYITEAIESAMMQQGDFKWRLLVADNASTDGSADIIKKYADKYPDKITAIFRPSNIGWYPSMIDMFEQMNSEYYFILCSDDFLMSDRKLVDAVEFLDAHPDFTLYCSNVEILEEGRKEGRKEFLCRKSTTQNFTFDDFINERKINRDRVEPVQELGMVLRNVLYNNGIPEELKFGNPDYFGGDTFRWIATLAKGKGHFVNKSYGCYRVTGEGVWSSLSLLEQHMAHIRAFINLGEYFKEINNGYFEYHAWQYTMRALEEMHKIMLENDIAINEEFIKLFSIVNSKRDMIARFIKNVYPDGLDAEKRKRHYWRRKFKSIIKNFLHIA